MIRFEDPWLLFFLVIIPLMILYQWKGIGKNRVIFSSLNNLKKLRKPTSLFLRHILLVLRCLTISLFVIALACPQLGAKITEVFADGIDIMLCLDTSKSMQITDMEIDWTPQFNEERQNRLQIVKKIVRNFIKGRQCDPIGMVVFGDDAFTQCPLTLDHGILLSFLDQMEIGMAGDSTAIGSALAICVKRLKDRSSKSKVVILLTDGRSNVGTITPENAAKIAKAFSIKTYTIGIGRKEYQRMDLDEGTLKEIAEITGGTYFNATGEKALENIYEQINKLEKTKVKINKFVEYEELFPWFLVSGLISILLEIILTNTRFRKIP